MNPVDGQTLLTICISALIFFSLGSLAGWLISLLRAPNQPSVHPVEAPMPPNAPDTPTDADKLELARIYRRRSDDQIFLETQGKPMITAADVHPAERTWLVWTAEAIYQLLGQSPPPAEPRQSNLPAPLPRSPSTWQTAPAQVPQKPSMNPADVLIRAAQAGQPKPDQPKRLVEQIDAVLQEILAQSPLPVGEIHLSENADLGLEVRLGNLRYDGIEAVPDESVRRVIRAAIAEWQRRAH